jgi:polyhydroxyalkanoate synthesis regulator phasin
MPAPRSSGEEGGTGDAVVLTRAHLREALDDAVSRGRMSRGDAGDLLAELMRRGRRATEELVAEARRAAELEGAFPIPDYDELTAAEVIARLETLATPELRRVRDHERRNANRKSVLGALEHRLGP